MEFNIVSHVFHQCLLIVPYKFLDAKFEEVERLMRKKTKEDKSIEEKLLNYQRKYEAQKKAELKAEVCFTKHITDFLI